MKTLIQWRVEMQCSPQVEESSDDGVHVFRLQVFKSLRTLCVSVIWLWPSSAEKLRVANVQCCPLPVIKHRRRKTDLRETTSTNICWTGWMSGGEMTQMWLLFSLLVLPVHVLASWITKHVSVTVLHHYGVSNNVPVVSISCLFTGFTSLSLPPSLLASSKLCDAWGGEINVVMAAQHFFVKAQWSGALWIWLHPPGLAADQQHCGTLERSGQNTIV